MIQLEMLCEVDRICRKCNIHYNIIAGTLLGAVRHQGYIPWDDDADIALLRSEYERFKEACTEFGIVDKPIKSEGRALVMFITPKSSK